MITEVNRIGNTELYIIRVQNINVANSYNLFWEYTEILSKVKKQYAKQLSKKDNYKTELKIIYQCKKELHDLIYNQEVVRRQSNER